MSNVIATKSLLDVCTDTMSLRSFTTAYNKTFKLTRCKTLEEEGKALRLRHKVFCEEYGYECPSEEGSFEERDEYDERAIHHVLSHRISNEVAGALRVILPNDEKPGESFPSQKICDHPLLQQDSRVLSLCEISRFCMAPRFRKRSSDGKFLSSYHNQDNTNAHMQGKSTFVRRKIAYPQAGLLQGAFETAMEARILDCIWMVEPTHLESLKEIGFPYRALGPQVEHHGGLVPIIFNIKHVLDNMRREVPSCWEIISDSGRLQFMADELQQHHWCDDLMDQACQDKILEKLIT